MLKQRKDVISSSLGSYFGVGFNTPDEQIQIDLGLIPNEFDEAAQDRMNLGIALEDSVLNYFEKKLDIIISNRNEEIIYAFNKMLKCKVDGMCIYKGIQTVVECKVSNSSMGPFTENMGYYFQCQAYMEATNSLQCLLLGLYNGKPIYKIIKRDNECIQDMKKMVTFIFGVLNELDVWENYPKDLLEKYSKTILLEPLENINEEDLSVFNSLSTVKNAIKELQKEEKELTDYIKDKFDVGVLDTNFYKCTIAQKSRKGSIDTAMISIEHPNIDIEKYRSPDSIYREIRLTNKKIKGE